MPFPIEDVWKVLSRPSQFPIWWHGVYLSAEPLDHCSEPLVGERVAVVARGWLPYKLRFIVETTALEKPVLIAFKASGDFDTDDSRWILTPHGSSTHVVLRWNPVVRKPIVKLWRTLAGGRIHLCFIRSGLLNPQSVNCVPLPDLNEC